MLFLPGTGGSFATEYFVSVDGSNDHSGTNWSDAFRTVQRGVDALRAGDRLTIGPGEYFESVKREGLGSPDSETLIRAAVPGTVLLRGDVPAPAFRPLPDQPTIAVAEYHGKIQAVNEVDTLKQLERQQELNELAFTPGSYFYEENAGRLYVSTTDFRPAEEHDYAISQIPEDGLFLLAPVRVTVDGLAVTGFNSETMRPDSPGKYAAWGIIFANATESVIRRSVAYLNGGGIVIATGTGGRNVIADCVAYGNGSPHSGEGGNIMFFGPRRDVIRRCLSYKPKGYGLRLYGARPENTAADGSVIEDSLAWGSSAGDLFVKGGGVAEHALTRNTIAVNNGHALNIENTLIGAINQYRTPEETSRDSVRLLAERISRDAEFADPVNFDFRLQSSSHLRGSGPGGRDRGPLPYRGDVCFVRPDGNDAADGLSMAAAWRTISHAVQAAGAGSTIYLAAGAYDGGFSLAGKGSDALTIRGRGRDRVDISGSVEVQGNHGVRFERVNFLGPVKVQEASGTTFENCRFVGRDGLESEGADALSVTHCEFSGFTRAAITMSGCSKAFLQSNMYDNASGPVVVIDGDRTAAIAYSDYHGYSDPEKAMKSEGSVLPLSALAAEGERHSRALRLAGDHRFGGAFGRRIGVHGDSQVEELHMTKPVVRSVSATTADIEWTVSARAASAIAWGVTPACENTAEHLNPHDNEDLLAAFSLTGLKPDTKYYFQIRTVTAPESPDGLGQPPLANPEFDRITFTTAKESAAPRTLFVAPDGNDARSGLSRSEAWRTLTHAAAQVRPGDTVLAAGGRYTERVRMRATGEKGLPITFKNLPGEKVILDSDEKRLDRAFIITGKKHIVIDGFHFKAFRMAHWHTGTISLVQSDDITVSRCFYDGRGQGYPASFLNASDCDNLTIADCVIMSGIFGIDIRGCAGLTVENNVFIRNMIEATKIRAHGPGNVVRNNIFTDSMAGKVRVYLHDWNGYKLIEERDNCYVLRISDEDRKPFMLADYREQPDDPGRCRMGIAEYDRKIARTGSVVADPDFPVLRALNQQSPENYAMDAIFREKPAMDFSDVFTGNPELRRRGIGLREASFQAELPVAADGGKNPDAAPRLSGIPGDH